MDQLAHSNDMSTSQILHMQEDSVGDDYMMRNISDRASIEETKLPKKSIDFYNNIQ